VAYPRLHISLLTLRLPPSSHTGIPTTGHSLPENKQAPSSAQAHPSSAALGKPQGGHHAMPAPGLVASTRPQVTHHPLPTPTHPQTTALPPPEPCLKQRDARNSLPHPLPTRRTAPRPPPSPTPMARLLLLKAPLLRLMPVPPLPARPLRARSTYNHLTSPPSPPSPSSLPSSYFMPALFRTQRAFPLACRTTHQHHTYTPTHPQTA